MDTRERFVEDCNIHSFVSIPLIVCSLLPVALAELFYVSDDASPDCVN